MEIILYNAILLLLEAFFMGAMGRTGLWTNKMTQMSFMVLAFVQLFVLHAFLDISTMPDLPAYEYMYRKLENISPFATIRGNSGAFKMEVGWRVMNKALCMIWNNPRFLLIVTSFGIIGGYFAVIRKYSPMIGLSVLLFYFIIFVQSLFVLRQHLAMSLCILAIPSIINRNQVKFLILVLLAFSLHKTAIVFLPAYYVYKLEINRKLWIWFIALIVIGTPASKLVGAWIYANTWYGGYNNEHYANATQLMVQLLVVFLYLYSVRWKVDVSNKVEKVFLLLGLMSLLLTFWGMGLGGFGGRLALYFMLADIFLIPFSIERIPDQAQRLIITALTIVCFGALFYAKIDPGLVNKYYLIFLQ